MRIGRAIVIPALFTLAMAGYSLAGTAAPAAAAAHISSVHVLATGAAPALSGVFYHC
jgi:hypothetical protein